jgi:polyphosphate kinase 2 (PPK2 family)
MDDQPAVKTAPAAAASAADISKPAPAKAGGNAKTTSSPVTGDAARGAEYRHQLAEMKHTPETIRHLFENGEYPYHTRMRRSVYEKQKAELQVELLKVQRWVKESGQKIVILFEGRDAAGKGGTIKRFMEHLNPRGARVVALEKPSVEQ